MGAIVTGEGVWVEKQGEVLQEITGFYSGLYKRWDVDGGEKKERFLGELERKVGEGDGAELEKDIMREEVRESAGWDEEE